MALTLAALTVISFTYAGEPAPTIAAPSLEPVGTVIVADKKKKERPPARPSGESTHQDHKGEIEVMAARVKSKRVLPDVAKQPTRPADFVPIPYPNT